MIKNNWTLSLIVKIKFKINKSIIHKTKPTPYTCLCLSPNLTLSSSNPLKLISTSKTSSPLPNLLSTHPKCTESHRPVPFFILSNRLSTQVYQKISNPTGTFPRQKWIRFSLETLICHLIPLMIWESLITISIPKDTRVISISIEIRIMLSPLGM